MRRAIERGLPVTCAPGPSAVLDALALSGLPTDRFCYEGFLPRKHSERVQHLRMLQSERRTIVFYETPHRIADSMDDLLDAFGPNRAMALCRELTKDYEEIRRGMVGTIRQSVVDNPPRGEMVLVIGGAFGIVMRTGTIDNGILALILHTRGNEILFIPALFILFSLGGAVFGMGEEAVAFAIIIAPLMVRLGYDSITTVLVTYIATQIGFASSWMNPFCVVVAQGSAGVPVLSSSGLRA